MPDRTHRAILWTLAIVGLLTDQATKYGVFAWLKGVEGHTFALFQTRPESRFMALVPADPAQRDLKRGFFLEVAFHRTEDGGLREHVNHGALFGLFGQHETAANLGFAFISLLAAIGILAWSRLEATARDRWLCASLGLILAGTLGNLYDRLMFNGVRDFLHWHQGFDWPVFNVADVCLVCGAGMLMIQAFLVPQPDGRKDEDGRKALAMTGTATGVRV